MPRRAATGRAAGHSCGCRRERPTPAEPRCKGSRPTPRRRGIPPGVSCRIHCIPSRPLLAGTPLAVAPPVPVPARQPHGRSGSPALPPVSPPAAMQADMADTPPRRHPTRGVGHDPLHPGTRKRMPGAPAPRAVSARHRPAPAQPSTTTSSPTRTTPPPSAGSSRMPRVGSA